MTTREFLNDVESIMYALQRNENISGEEIVSVREKAAELLAAMDAKNEKAKARPRKTDDEVAARRDAIADFIASSSGEFTVDEVASLTGLTAPQVASAMRAPISAGMVKKGARKIDSKHSKVTYIIGE